MRLFAALDIKVVTMEKPTYASFSSLMYDKFRALQKTEYKRFIYLDADILPLVNLDYYFHLSDPDEKSLPTILQPNLNWATKKAPCNGGMFMMDPAVGAWEQLTDIVNKQRKEGLYIPYPHFDYERGWGHNFTDFGDYWESMSRNGTDWHFYGSHTDQGLWFYYSKYVRKDVSILIGPKLQNWAANKEESTLLPVMVDEVIGGLSKYSPKPIVYQHHCDDPKYKYRCHSPSMDVAHFMANDKPWIQGIKKSWFYIENDTDNMNDAHRLWFKELDKLSKELNLGLDVYNWKQKHADLAKPPPFGLKPGWKDNAKDILNKKILVSDKHHGDTELIIRRNEEAKSEENQISADFNKIHLSEELEIKKHSILAPRNELATAVKKNRYAYNFVLGGIHENNLAYKGFLYNILISVNLLNKLGSEADFWVWAQLSANSTLDEIPDEDMRLFAALDIKVVKMEKPTYVSFSSLMLDKFRALQKTEYKRFMFLDADILPLVNLDYYFYLSDPDEESLPTILQPNLNIASKRAPCYGGMFMMDPAVGAWEQLADAVNKQHEEGLKIPYPHFDRLTWGWGHDFKGSGDKWEAINRKGATWQFYGSQTDQGLWFYYSKYVRKNVSILIGERLQTWVRSDDENAELPVMEKEEIGSFSKYSPKPLVYQFNCNDHGRTCSLQTSDIAHFMLKTKPWLVGTKNSWVRNGIDNDNLNAPTRLWFKELGELSTILHMGLDIDNWNEKHANLMQSPPLGFKAKPTENAELILSKQKLTGDATS